MRIFGIQIQSFNHIVYNNNINNNCCYDFECLNNIVMISYICRYFALFIDKNTAVLTIKGLQNHHIAI